MQKYSRLFFLYLSAGIQWKGSIKSLTILSISIYLRYANNDPDSAYKDHVRMEHARNSKLISNAFAKKAILVVYVIEKLRLRV